MSAKGGSSLATVLFSVPLAAIPLMAIFGIPQFAPVVASPDPASTAPDDETLLGEPEPEYRRRASDLTRPYEDRGLSQPISDAPLYDGGDSQFAANTGSAHDGGNTVRPEGLAQLDSRERSTANAAVSGQSLSGSSDPFGDAWQNEPSASNPSEFTETEPATAAPGLTWREAARQLSEMGIEDYHLEPGADDGTFLFVCSLAPAGTTNVSMRFEAEADDPLAAVRDVLGQVDRWLRQRYAQSRHQ